MIKSRHINISTSKEFPAKASKGVPSIKFLYLSKAIKETLDVYHIKYDYNLENLCFIEFCYLPDDKEAFHTQH